jgi:hypothetical protein
MVELRTTESYSCMATVTTQCCLKVIGGFNHVSPGQQIAAGMATRTFARCAFENSVYVTRLAARTGVHAIERKACFHMVKVF